MVCVWDIAFAEFDDINFPPWPISSYCHYEVDQLAKYLKISSLKPLLSRLQHNTISACPPFYELPPEDMALALTYLHNTVVLLFYLFLIAHNYFLQSH